MQLRRHIYYRDRYTGFVFFQAEDGIRDVAVTGVQTCALPIFQALGNWERHMAPPSILEFIVVLLMRQAASFAVPSLSKSLHLGTKGCLFDFTSELTEARYKALQSFVCSTCRSRMQESGAVHLADDTTHVLDFSWLGATSDPHCPAGIVAKLGYDLFLTKIGRAHV